MKNKEKRKLKKPKGINIEFPILSIGKKFYCFKCGKKVEKIKDVTTELVEGGFYCNFNGLSLNIGYKSDKVIDNVKYFYRCLDCKMLLTFEKQYEVSMKQKSLKKNILTEEEMKDQDLTIKSLKMVKFRKMIVDIVYGLFFVILFLIALYFRLKQEGIL